jgi:hypothetical protein
MVRRLARAVVVAFLLAISVGVVQKSMDIPIPSICDSLEPGGFWWWWWGCKDSAGGGGGGAG